MIEHIAILILSILLQMVAIILAFRLTGVTGRAWPWLFFAGMIVFMLVRRVLELQGLVELGESTPATLLSAVSSVLISGFMVAGLALIAPIFRSLFEAQRRLREEKDFVTDLVRTSPTLFVAIDGEGRTMMMNDSLLSLLGYRSDEVIGRDYLSNFVYPEDREELRAIFDRLTDGSPQTTHNENRLHTRDGRAVLTEWYGRPVLGANGRVKHFFGVGLDLTEKRKTEEELRLLATVVEQAAEAVAVFDQDFSLHYANPAFERLSGFERAELMGNQPFALATAEPLGPAWPEVRLQLAAGEVWSGVYRCRRKDGSLYHVESTISPVRTPAGEIGSYVEIADDITRDLSLEAQLRQAQKMEAVGRLAGGIAHDFNNILTAIIGYAQISKQRAPASSPPAANAERILDAAGKGAALTRQLLLFSRNRMVEPQVVNLRELLQGVQQLLSRLLGEEIEQRLEISPGLWNVRIDPSQFEQVMLNLAVNSRDAMPGGGRLVIRAENVPVTAEVALLELDVEPGDHVRIVVQDSGCGMTPEVLAKVFDPFFTTKEAGKGTGMGLAIVYGVVRGAGGAVGIESEPGRGTTVRCYLPATREEVRNPTVPVAVRPAPGRGELILLVEDDAAVRELILTVLDGAGYRVLAAEDGRQALAAARQAGEPINLLLSDLVMPGLSGLELSQKMQDMQPGLRLLLMSGYAEERVRQDHELPGGPGFLPKPFSPELLLSKVREILDGR